MIGHVVGNYKVVELIGEGGMGAVYRGIDLMLEREVAIKVLRPELASQPQVVERFRSEAVTLAKLNHPNVATLYSFFRQANDFFMVMEFVRGETLDRIITARGAMSCDQAIAMFCQVLEGIDHAHRLGIIHRDIKPANMMLTGAGVLKVLDFGIARVLGTSRMTRQGHLIGTIEYMSPEQVRGLETDARSDIYSLGMLLYEMLTGRVPFNSNSEFDLMRSQVEEMPPPPRQFAPHIPDVIEQAILCAVAKQPNERFQTAGDFRAALLSTGLLPATGGSGSLTGSYARPSWPPIIAPDTGANAALGASASGETVKETRLGSAAEVQANVAAAADAPQIKETRLGVAPVASSAEVSASVSTEPTAEQFSMPPMIALDNATAPQATTAQAATDDGRSATTDAPVVVGVPKYNVKLIAAVAGGLALLLIIGSVSLFFVWRHANQKRAAEQAAAQRAAQQAEARRLEEEEARRRTVQPTPPDGMVYVKGGEFQMGNDAGDEYEKPAHTVAVKSFFIDQYEVTNEDYAKFVKETNHKPPQTWQNGTYPDGAARHPVTGVTWDDANDYAQWAHKRLPTEAEWEFAARGSEGLKYPWGNEWQPGMANADKVNQGVQDVGAAQGKSPFGAYDMVGNAWEWTASPLTEYPGGHLTKPPASTEKVIRGGCYQNSSSLATTTLRRGWPAQGSTYTDTGFRCAKDIDASASVH